MSGPSLARATRTMAVATLVSRLTGFLRSVVLVSAITFGLVGDAYNTANTLPLIVYELLLGGVLSSVVVPLLVHARVRDPDDGVAYAQRLLTLATVVLAGATVVAIVVAPALTWAYGIRDDPAQVALATLLARILLVEIVFLGLSAMLGAVLNSRQVFAPPAWAPVLNNIVVIVTGLLFIALDTGAELTPETIPTGLVWLLGVGTTLGIVVQAVALLPAMRRAGVPWAWRWDWRGTGLGEAGRLGVWVLAYVAVSQIGYLVVLSTANAAGRASGVGSTVYTYASLLFQLPYGVIGVALLTALLPRMSRAAADGDTAAVVADLSLGSRLSAVALLPISALMIALGPAVSIVAFARGKVGVDTAEVVGVVLASSAFGLLPFAITMLQLRAFYALKDARTPTLVNLAMVAVRVPLCLLVPVLLPADHVVLGLAVVNSVSFVVGAVVGEHLLRRRLGRLDTARVLRTCGLLLAASVVGGLAAWAVATPVQGALTPGALGSLVAVLAGSLVGGSVLLAGCLVVGVPEVRELLGSVRTRLGRGTAAGSPAGPGSASEGGQRVRSGGQDGIHPAGEQPPPPGEGEATATSGLQAPPTVAMPVPAPPPAATPARPGAGVDRPVTLAGRYELVERSGTDQSSGHGRLSTWRATDVLLRRDVLLRIHAPGGEAAATFLSRALSAGALSHPALAMVYDAVDEGRRAYVVSEWVDGTTLGDALRGGPLTERDARETIRRLAEGVAQAHARGIAVGGLTLDRVVLTRGGSVCVSGIPAPEATRAGDVRALGVLLFATLAGFLPVTDDPAELERQLTNAAAPDLADVALAVLSGRVRAAGDVATLLVAGRRRRLPTDDGGLAFITDRYEYEPLESAQPPDATVAVPTVTPPAVGTAEPNTAPPNRVPPSVPPAVPPTAPPTVAIPAPAPSVEQTRPGPAVPAREHVVTVSAPVSAADEAPAPLDDDGDGDGDGDGDPPDRDRGAPLFGPGGFGWDPSDQSTGDIALDAPAREEPPVGYSTDRADERDDEDESEGRRRTWLVLAFPIAALLAVALVGWVLAGTFTSVGQDAGILPTEGATTSSAAAPTSASPTPTPTPTATAGPLAVVGVTVFDPFGDGESENGGQAPLASDGDPATSWSTLTYRGSPALGNLKPGVGLVFDLGAPVTVQQVVLSTDQPGSTVQVRAGAQPGGGDLEVFAVAGETALAAQSTVDTADAPAARYWLVWVTQLVPDGGSFSASLSEVQFVGLPAA